MSISFHEYYHCIYYTLCLSFSYLKKNYHLSYLGVKGFQLYEYINIYTDVHTQEKNNKCTKKGMTFLK